MTCYGYARVSSTDQNLNRQIDALIAEGIEDGNIFKDKASGKDFERPAYNHMIKNLKHGDVLFITSIDRLGRNYDEVRGEWRRITSEKQADIVVLDMPVLDTRSKDCGLTGRFISDIVLDVLAYVSAQERDKIRERQRQGIDAAMARGVKFGRPRIERPESYERIKAAYLRGEIRRKNAAAQLGISTTTFDSWVKNDLIDEGWE